ncbi:hypothetical protein BC938DRAFT_478735 [Jimgerdemannia flammicorona]|uniref:Uncharacterized protein n=1 Tax=Jimgerdemannia flammicorona TaxID=994334 RepID=A0A433P4W8_9FUNG|nr:hypothetical protein BC938DRAFT_478735 [Jimgerdemannia flammicorona]
MKIPLFWGSIVECGKTRMNLLLQRAWAKHVALGAADVTRVERTVLNNEGDRTISSRITVCKRNCFDCQTTTISLKRKRPSTDTARAMRTTHGPCATGTCCHRDEDRPMECAFQLLVAVQ